MSKLDKNIKSIFFVNTLTIRSIIIGSFFITTAAPINAQVPIQQQVKEGVTHLVGAMDTSAQAKTNPASFNVRITTCQVQVATDVSNAVFLYQEQALTKQLGKPYRQRFLQIAPTKDNLLVESKTFKPQTPQAWVGLCSKPEAQRVMQHSQLGESNCSVFLKKADKNYVGETSPGGCPINFRGATRITNTIILHQSGMDTRDRGFDATGKQVWGAKEQPYQFRWVNISKQ